MAVMTKLEKLAITVWAFYALFITLSYVSKHICVECCKVYGLIEQSRLCEAFKNENDASAIGLCICFTQLYHVPPMGGGGSPIDSLMHCNSLLNSSA